MKLLFVVGAAAALAQEPADLVIRNAKVFTADAQRSLARTVVIRGERIAAVGGDDLAAKYRAAGTLDAGGRLVIPGFNDTHIHLRGNPPYYVELEDARSVQEILERVSTMADKLGPGQWITGGNWSEDQLEEKRRPLRADLDKAAPENPVVLTRAGGHSSVGNSLALKIAGITRATPDPERGVIEKDARGEPNGVVRERNDLFLRHVPRPARESLRPSLIARLKWLLSLGITSFILAGASPEDYAEWQAIYAQHGAELPRATIQIYWPGVEGLKRFGRRTGDGDERIRVGAIKMLVDGGFTGPAAYTIAPYKGQGDYRGKLTMTPQELYERIRESHKAGWQLGLHTIGDAAIQLTVDTFERVLQEFPRADHRHYLNHFSMTPPAETYEKIKQLGLWISQQPNFTYTLEGRYNDYLDPARAAVNNPVGTPWRKGIFMALSSDILPIGPMVGLYAAVTRKGMSGAVYGPEERIPMEDALLGYTRNTAYFSREEKLKGTIEAGKLADLVVLEQDLLTIDPAKILETKVHATVLGGRIVYRSGKR
jgi:predicted amidohydrolase YtcJ